MLKKPAKILLAILLTTGLSGCLVEKKDPADIETISRNGVSNWRIYQAGDWIEYNVQAVDPSTATTTLGILRVHWEDANIQDPIDSGTSYKVLKETTTLTNEGSTDPDEIVVRYISQITDAADPNQGRILLHAIDDETGTPGSPTLYWPYESSSAPSDTPVITPTLFDSPLVFGQPSNSGQHFSIMQCESGLCKTPLYTYQDYEIDVVNDLTSIETPLGIFSDPFLVNFSGGSTPIGTEALTFVGDVRDLCGTISDTIFHGTATGSGSLYVFPEIGIIKMKNTCEVTGLDGNTIDYTATLRDTSINF